MNPRRGRMLRWVTSSVFILITCAVTWHVTAQTPTGAVPLPPGATLTDTVADAARATSLLKARLGQSFAVADFNRDGLTDVAAADFLSDSLKLFFGEAGGGLGAPTTLATGRGPRSVVAADLNDDGAIDLAVGEFLSGSVRVFPGRGDGRFGDAYSLPLAHGITSLVAYDLDGDGRVDLAAANPLSGSILTLRNEGSGSFLSTEIGRVEAPTLVLRQDVNGDGTADLVAVDADGRTAWMFAADEAGTFQQPRSVEPSWIGAIVDASRETLTPPGGARLQTVAGDGQVHIGGLQTAEPLVVSLGDWRGVASPGEMVSFARVIGQAEILIDAATGISAASVRATDESGRASVAVLLPRLPDASVMTASVAPDQLVAFRMVSPVPHNELARMIVAALREEDRDPRTVAALRAMMQDALERLTAGDAVAAMGDLIAMLDTVRTQGTATVPAGHPRVADDLVRRFLQQVLLLGASPRVPDDEPIVCDVPLTRTIAAPTEVDRFRYTGVGGERVHVLFHNDGGIATFNPFWRLRAPDGTEISCPGNAHGERDCLLSAAGTYTIEVADLGADGTGTYSVSIAPLTAGRRCGPTSLTCDVPASNTIDAPLDSDIHEFDFTAVAGERVHVAFHNDGGTATFNPFWRLRAPDGTEINCPGNAHGERDCVLPAAAVYAIEVEDLALNGTGAYSLNIVRLTASLRCGTTSLTCDVPASNTINTPLDTDIHEFDFTAVAGERVHVAFHNDGGTATFNPFWRLRAPDGSEINCPGNAHGERDCVLPAAAVYAIEVEDLALDGTGAYSLNIERLTAGQRCGTTTACDVPVTTDISARVDTDLHEFSGVAGELVHIVLRNDGGSQSFNPVWRLLASDGSPATVCGGFAFGERDCTLPATDSAYAIEVEDLGLDATGSYSVLVQRLTPGLRCGPAVRDDASLDGAVWAPPTTTDVPGRTRR